MSERREEARWWMRVMNYIRTIPGTIYSEQLYQLTRYFDCPESVSKRLHGSDAPDPVGYFNRAEAARTEGLIEDRDICYLKKDPVTGGVFTLPESRRVLDKAVWRLFRQAEQEGSPFPEECLSYNKYLYEPLELTDEQVTEFPGTVSDAFIFRLREQGFLQYDDEQHSLDIDFGSLRQKDGTYGYVRNFNICRLLEYFEEKKNAPCRLGSILGDKTVFLGETVLSSMDRIADNLQIGGRLSFNCATFERDVEFNYVRFLCEGIHGVVADFRDACFLGDVAFRNSVFEAEGPNMELSFEDAKLYGKLVLNHVQMGELKLNCFQTIFAGASPSGSDNSFRKRVGIINTEFGGSSMIDFSDAEFGTAGPSKVEFQNVKTMPITKLTLAPDKSTAPGQKLCPQVYLLMENCEIQNTLYIGNVMIASFYHSQNYSRIVTSPQWDAFPRLSRGVRAAQFFGRDGSHVCPRTKTKGIGRTKIVSKLLAAVYNNDQAEDFGSKKELDCAKGADFLMLKENFGSQGMYDSEDVAFILFMEYKPRLDVKNKSDSNLKRAANMVLYKILYATGRYGISPNRVLAAIIAVILFFTVVFCFFFLAIRQNAFSLGSSLMEWNKIEGAYQVSRMAGFWDTLLRSFLYSLENVVPFVSQFEAINLTVIIFTAIENFLGSFLIGYFSVAVMRKILK